jgi:hypothetical protein
VLPYCLMDSGLGCFQLPPHKLGTRRVVVCSCATAGVLREGVYGAASPPLQFDFVMVDEAGQVGRGHCMSHDSHRNRTCRLEPVSSAW